MIKPTRARAFAAAALAASLAAVPAFGQGSDGPKTPLPPRDAPRAQQPGQQSAHPNPDWPCIQRKVPSMSYGQVWSGPPLDDAFKQWRDDPEVAALVSVLVARRTTPEEFGAAIERFVKAEGERKNAKLALVFAGAFEELNDQRGRMVTGIERYARKQRALSERIKDESLKLTSSRKDMATQNSPEFQQKEQTLNWDLRIYEERQQALGYVCESPVLIEQRIFELAREIQKHLD
jgi:hypothetical protein